MQKKWNLKSHDWHEMTFHIPKIVNICNDDHRIGANDEHKNSRRPKKLSDNQSTINEHLKHDPLHIDEHKDMTVRRIFTQLNCQKRYKKAFKSPLKASNY